MVPSGLLSLALLIPTAPPAVVPRLQRGDELTYTGTVTETVDRPGTRFRRTHNIEVRAFVLDRGNSWVDAAVLTTLRRADDGAVPVLPGRGADRTPPPPAARLDLVRIHDDGTTLLLVPPGPAPLRFAADTPVRVLPAPPLDSFAAFEFGMFPPHTPTDGSGSWAIASTDPTRPAETWEVKGSGLVNAERCQKLVMTQQTSTWEAPRGGQAAWQRVDEVWVSSQDGAAHRVHRVIRQRDGVSPDVAVCIDVAYELKDQARLIQRTYDGYRKEIEIAYAAGVDLAPLLKNAVRLGPQPFVTRLAKLAPYLDETDPGTPYREAIRAVQRQLEAARRGEASTLNSINTPPPPMAVTRAAQSSSVGKEPGPRVASLAPDFQTGTFRLAAARGRPVVLIFFMPGVETADLSLAIADGLRKRYGERITVVPLAVFAPTSAGEKDRDRLRLSLPMFDGSAAVAAYAVETFPRFLVVDAGGTVQWVFTGVGAETGFLAREHIDALLTPLPGTVAPTATTSPPGPAVLGSTTRR
jgi:hypothetical protein